MIWKSICTPWNSEKCGVNLYSQPQIKIYFYSLPQTLVRGDQVLTFWTLCKMWGRKLILYITMKLQYNIETRKKNMVVTVSCSDQMRLNWIMCRSMCNQNYYCTLSWTHLTVTQCWHIRWGHISVGQSLREQGWTQLLKSYKRFQTTTLDQSILSLSFIGFAKRMMSKNK